MTTVGRGPWMEIMLTTSNKIWMADYVEILCDDSCYKFLSNDV